MAELRTWRTQGQVARAESSHGGYLLKIRYRVSQTHVQKAQYKSFSSTDFRWGGAARWATKEEALSHAAEFTAFVQRGFANAGGGGSQSAAHAAAPPSFDAATASPRRLQRHGASTSTDSLTMEGGVRRARGAREARAPARASSQPPASRRYPRPVLSLEFFWCACLQVAPSGGRRIDFDEQQPSKVRLLSVTAPQPDGTGWLHVRLALNKTDPQIASIESRLQNFQQRQRRWVASRWAPGDLPRPLQKDRVAGKLRGRHRREAPETRAATASEPAQLARPQLRALQNRKRHGWGRGARGRASRSHLVERVVTRVAATLTQKREKQAEQSRYRLAEIERLQDAIRLGRTEQMLVPALENQSVTAKQVARVETQCMALCEYFQLLEGAAQAS